MLRMFLSMVKLICLKHFDFEIQIENYYKLGQFCIELKITQFDNLLFNSRAESEKDFGVVHCWAGNMLGESSKPCIFTLIPAGE